MSFRNALLLLCSTTFLLNCNYTTDGKFWNHTTAGQAWNKQNKTIDTIDSFVLTKDKHRVIFVSKEYHYVFDTSQTLINILELSDNKFLRVYLSKSFNLDSKNKITGSFVLGAKEDEVTPTQLINMKNIGFTKNKQSNEYTLKINLSGERFLSKSINFDNLGKLNEKYLVHINIDKTLGDKLTLAAATPFFVAMDVAAVTLVLSVGLLAAPAYYGEKLAEEHWGN